VRINGLNALAPPTTRTPTSIDVTKYQLSEGPAYGKIEDSDARAGDQDWPTFRHDATRSGVASCPAPTQLNKHWNTQLEGKLSAPVVAGGRVYVAANDENVYGFGRQKKYFQRTTAMEYRVFAEPKQRAPREEKRKKGSKGPEWETNVPILASGLTVAQDTLFTAGPPDVLDETKPGIRTGDTLAVRKAVDDQAAALEGERGGIFLAVSKTKGEVQLRRDIDVPPVFDGLIAANGRLYLALENGTVQCWK
jgi:hypothetical protein